MQTKKGYITIAEVEKYCDIAITDEDEAIERMEIAEDMVDDYVGFQVKFLRGDESGIATGGTTTTLEDTSAGTPLNTALDQRYKFCTLQILSGSNAGEERLITDHDGTTLTVHSAFDYDILLGTVYRIYQDGKFPRLQDFEIENDTYYKYIIAQVKKATLAQFQYLLEMGDDFAVSGADKIEERWRDYAYKLSDSAKNRLISPKARNYLKGIVNRKGNLIGKRYAI
jgi:hypothetical protein